MGHIDHRAADIAVQFCDLETHVAAERRIEIGKRLVEEEHIGLAHQSATDGNALALATRKLARLALQ